MTRTATAALSSCLALVAGGLLAREVPKPAVPRTVVGVKIYESSRDPTALFRELRELGIDTVFASAALNLDEGFRKAATQHGVSRFVIFPTFYDPDALQADPGLYAVTARGEQAREEWVTFVCPSRPDFRRRKIEQVRRLIRESDPDGLSVDFIRHFVFWEKVYPDRDPASIPNTCFDAHCMAQFQEKTGIKLPASASSPREAAAWIRAHHLAAWTEWKCGLISGFVQEIAREAKLAKPSIRINVHAVPWRRDDFGGAIRTVAGQDFSAISRHADYISPMTYAHMVKREPAWVHAVVTDLAGQVSRPVIPSVQVGKAYLETPLTVSEFRESVNEALKPPSRGVVFWSWEALEKEPEKKTILKEVLKSWARGR